MLNDALIRGEINCWIQVTRWLRKLAEERQSYGRRRPHHMAWRARASSWHQLLAPPPTQFQVRTARNVVLEIKFPWLRSPYKITPLSRWWERLQSETVKTRGGGSFGGSYAHLCVYLCRDILFLKELFRVIWLFPLSSQFHKHVDTWQLSGHCWPPWGCNQGV